MKKTALILALAGAITIVSGCTSTPGYECKIPGACAPVKQSYDEAVADTSWSGWAVGDHSGNSTEKSGDEKLTKKQKADALKEQSVAVKAVQATMAPKAYLGTDKPVYTPPKPWRAWLAPAPVADGSVVSGSYVWFVTPGYWTYLGNKWDASPLGVASKGSGSDVSWLTQSGELQPIKPSQLGFTPGKSVQREGVISDMTQPEASQ